MNACCGRPPADTAVNADQPYAGVLYLDNVVYAKGERATDAWQLRLGVVGPASLAEPVQKGFHKAIRHDTELPQSPFARR